jgi:hypothetical protein
MSFLRTWKRFSAALCALLVVAPSAHAGVLGLFGQTQPTPEPSSVILIGIGAAGVFAYTYRKRRKKIV